MVTLSNRTIRRYAGIATNVAASTDIQIVIGDALLPVRIWRVKVKQTSGSAAAFTPRVFKAAGATVDSIDQEFVGTAATAASIFDAVAQADSVTDAAGKLYLRPTPNVGADNVYAYEVFIEIGR